MHPVSKLAGSLLADVAVWKAVSSFVQTTVLFSPITTVIVLGLYPYRVVLPAVYPAYGVLAPEMIVTLTQTAGVVAQFTALVVDVAVVVVVCLPATSN